MGGKFPTHSHTATLLLFLAPIYIVRCRFHGFLTSRWLSASLSLLCGRFRRLTVVSLPLRALSVRVVHHGPRKAHQGRLDRL